MRVITFISKPYLDSHVGGREKFDLIVPVYSVQVGERKRFSQVVYLFLSQVKRITPFFTTHQLDPLDGGESFRS